MRVIRVAGILLLLNLIVLQSKAQAVFCPPNVDFENSNFTNWELYTGNCCPISTPTLSGAVSSRHTITSGATMDPYGNFPIVAPGSGNYSLRLGNDGTGSQAERARYYVRVPNDLNNYSLILRYAVVLEDGGHSAVDQPRFEVKGYDSLTNVALPCVQFNFVASSSLPGFTTSTVNTDVKYKSWSTATINLSGFAGKTIALDFASGDCDLGGHFGYGYIDLNCGLFQISSTACSGASTASLSAPPGFQFYKWYDSTFTTLVGSAMTITVPAPTVTTKYYVVLEPYPGFGCKDTLTTRVSISDLSLIINPDTLVCINPSIQLRDTANASSAFLPLTYKWTPTTGLSCNTCLNPIATPTKTTRYILKVTDATGCNVTDSVDIIGKLNIATQPSNVSQCRGTNAKFKVTVIGKEMNLFTYQWFKNGVLIPGAELDSLIIPTIGDSDTANYSVSVKGPCDTLVSTAAKLSIYTKPVMTQQPVNVSQCLGTRAVLKAKAFATSPLTYQWFRRGILLAGANKDSLVINTLAYSDTGSYFLRIQGCDSIYTDTVYLRTQPQTIITLQPIAINQCKGNKGVLKVAGTGFGTLTYQWRKNAVNIAGATKDSLFINSLQTTDVGTYSVIVTGGCNAVTSTNARIDLIAAPIVVTQPLSTLKCRNSRVVFKVTTTGSIGYQWLKNGVEIAGATKDSLVLPSIDFADSGSYTVKIRGTCDTLLSAVAKLTLYDIPQITLQPVGATQCIRSSYTLRGAATSSTALQYQWWKNGKKIIGATRDSLFIPVLATNDSGDYFMVVKGICDSVISDTVAVRIRYVTIQTQPVSAINCLSKDILFKVKAYSQDTIHYQWKINGIDILNETTDSLLVQNVGFGDTARYSVSTTTACDTAVSTDARLSIFAPTVITMTPQNAIQCHYTTAVFRAGGAGTGAISYQWYKNGILMPARTRDTLMVTQISYADTADLYTVMIKSFCDSVWTMPAHIKVFPIPDPGLPDSTLLCVNIGYIETNGFSQYLWNTGSIANKIPIFTDGFYSVKVTDVNVCTNSDTTYVKLKSLPILDAGPDSVLCNELTHQLTATAVLYDSVKWDLEPGGTFDTRDSLDPVFTPNIGEEGVKILKINAYNSCGVTTDEMKLTLKKRTSSAFTFEDTVVCEGSRPVKLIPQNMGGLFSTVYLTNDSFNPSESGLHHTTYTISENGCTDSSKQWIRVVPMPKSSFIFQSKQQSIDSAIVFIATSTKTLRYLWDFGNGDTTSTDTAVYKYPREGLYRVILVSAYEMCVDTVFKDFVIGGSNKIWIPNVFTPDGDGLNDVFKVTYINSKGGVLSIYNRWGQLVYKSNDLTVGWDGTFEGKTCESDVYVFVVDYITNEDERKLLKGNVTLIK